MWKGSREVGNGNWGDPYGACGYALGTSVEVNTGWETKHCDQYNIMAVHTRP